MARTGAVRRLSLVTMRPYSLAPDRSFRTTPDRGPGSHRPRLTIAPKRALRGCGGSGVEWWRCWSVPSVTAAEQDAVAVVVEVAESEA